ncbi:flippase-like domain-containing protein [Candidatus Pacearchaeota archaeon]|nr:flippase-like domain-containing protein [Candidatus Pacearchaeota archaeon]
MKWKTVCKFLPILGIGLFIYLIIKLDITKIFQEIKNLNLFLLPIILIIVVLFYLIQTSKWFVIARKQKIDLSFSEAFRINWISDFYGFVTPGKLGAIIRVNYLKNKGADIGKGVSNFVIDKFLDLASLFILAFGVGAIIFSKKIIPAAGIYVSGFIFVFLVIFFLIFYKKENCRRLLGFFHKRFVPKRFKEKSKNLFNSFYEDFPPISFLLGAFFLNLVCWVTNYFVLYLIAISLGISINFIYFLVILAISTVIAQIPITINGLGTREATLISLFGVMGVSSVKVFSMSVLGIMIMSIIPAIISIILILLEKKK